MYCVCTFEGRDCVYFKLCKAHCPSQASRYLMGWESGDLSPCFSVVSAPFCYLKSLTQSLRDLACDCEIRVGLVHLVLLPMILGILIFGEKWCYLYNLKLNLCIS